MSTTSDRARFEGDELEEFDFDDEFADDDTTEGDVGTEDVDGSPRSRGRAALDLFDDDDDDEPDDDEDDFDDDGYEYDEERER